MEFKHARALAQALNDHFNDHEIEQIIIGAREMFADRMNRGIVSAASADGTTMIETQTMLDKLERFLDRE